MLSTIISTSRILKLSALVLLLLVFSQSIITKAFDEDKVISELSRLKAENFKLKSQLLSCQVNLSNLSIKFDASGLAEDQKNFEEELRKELGADKDDKFNWETLKFEPVNSKDEKNPGNGRSNSSKLK